MSAALTPRKGYGILIDALNEVRDLPWRATIAGSPDRSPETAALVRRKLSEYGFEERVRLAGQLDEATLSALYSSADVFALASLYEGYGMAFAEAIAHGLPVVASGDGAVSDTVPRSAGFVCAAGDVAAFADALRSLLSNAALRREKAEGAWRHGQTLPELGRSTADTIAQSAGAGGLMNGFSKEWLRLREPADAAARNPDIAAALAAQLADRTEVKFTDLGCGAGANLRYTALLVPPGIRQRWRLFDHDPQLLSSAREELAAWADEAFETASGEFELKKDGRAIEVSFCEADLSTGVERFLQPDEIVTASAFFDLVSKDWITRFARAAAALSATVYAPLIYNGFQIWSPSHPADWPMVVAFNVHQRRDKGLGAAAGPDAAASFIMRCAMKDSCYAGRQLMAAWPGRCKLDRDACRKHRRRSRRIGSFRRTGHHKMEGKPPGGGLLPDRSHR